MDRPKENGIMKIGSTLTRLSMKYMPDPSIFAVVLTFIAFLLGVFVANVSPMQMVVNWYKGFWSLLSFAMQMALIIITGSAVADAPFTKRKIQQLAGSVKSAKQAAWLVTFVSVLVSYIHWGLSLIVGALLAKELAKELRIKKIPFEYGLIAAGAYVGQMTWHGMFSASIGLLIATPGHFLEDKIGIISMYDYMFNPMNIAVTIALLIFPPLFASMLHPNPDHVTPLTEESIKAIELETDSTAVLPKNPTVGDRLNNSKIVAGALGVSGIVFQFPLYAGIMGMIQYSGLVDILSKAMVSISTPGTFYLYTFLSASLVNMFVPSGGGQWVVQGPIAIDSAMMMDANIIKTCLAVAYGNTWTNMAQPFWAIALLGVTGLQARDIMGYSMAIMLMSGLIFILAVTFLPV